MKTLPVLSTALAVGLALSACTSSGSDSPDATEAAGTTITVTAADAQCELSATAAPAGPITFDINNDGSQVTEFYVYAEDGQTVKAEVENIGPGLSRDLTAELETGKYVTACKPGMTGDGVRGELTVTGGN